MKEILVFFAAMTPFIDLKLAIPLGMELGLASTSIFLFAVAGSIVPAAIGLAMAEPLSGFLRKNSQYMDTFFEKLFSKTRKHHAKRFERYGAIFIVFFVAIPIPGSGSFAGALIAFIFGVNYWKGISLVALGTVISGILLLAGFSSIFAILDLFT